MAQQIWISGLSILIYGSFDRWIIYIKIKASIIALIPINIGIKSMIDVESVIFRSCLLCEKSKKINLIFDL